MSNYIPGTSARTFEDTRDVSPWAIEQYLALSGWTQTEARPGLYGVWVAPRDAASILLPYDRELSDYQRRYREAYMTLSEVAGVAGEALALEIMSARKDIFFLRADQQTLDGSIPFLEAQRLIDGVQKLLLSAAATAIRPRASTAGKKPALVNDFMRDDVRMGHTLRGSFVITVLASDSAEDARRRQAWNMKNSRHAEIAESAPIVFDPTTDGDPTSYPRLVMSTLATGLRTARELVQGSATDKAVDEAVESGVTRQMLESIQEMGKSEGVRTLDMAFRWALSEPVEDDVPDRVQLPRADTAEMGKYIERFSKKPEVEDDVMVGLVVALERPEGSEEGQAVVNGFVGKRRRKVRVPLSGEAYRLAIAAHDTTDPVSVRGTFTRKQRGWHMEGSPSIALVHER